MGWIRDEISLGMPMKTLRVFGGVFQEKGWKIHRFLEMDQDAALARELLVRFLEDTGKIPLGSICVRINYSPHYFGLEMTFLHKDFLAVGEGCEVPIEEVDSISLFGAKHVAPS